MPDIQSPPQFEVKPSLKGIQLTRTKFIILVVSFVILLFLTGTISFILGKNLAKPLPKTEPEKQATPAAEKANINTGDLRQEVETGGYLTATLEEVKLNTDFEKQKKDQLDYNQKYPTYSSYPAFLKQNKLELRVSLKNKKDTPNTYNLGKFRLKDSDNTLYTIVDISDPKDSSMLPGETLKVTIYFVVPDKEKRFKLIYENAMINFNI